MRIQKNIFMSVLIAFAFGTTTVSTLFVLKLLYLSFRRFGGWGIGVDEGTLRGYSNVRLIK